jgi:ABC-type branched-subunit amino acid transport system permease subunit
MRIFDKIFEMASLIVCSIFEEVKANTRKVFNKEKKTKTTADLNYLQDAFTRFCLIMFANVLFLLLHVFYVWMVRK